MKLALTRETPYEVRHRRRLTRLLIATCLACLLVLVWWGTAWGEERYTPSSRSNQRTVDLVAAYFPPEELGTALDVIQCESQGRADAVGPYRERGWFQVHPIWQPLADAMFWPGVDLADPEVNVAVAKRLYDLFDGWGPWYSSRRCWAR